MKNSIKIQADFWDSNLQDFDSIYSHNKGAFANWLDKTFRWDMYERFNYTLRMSRPIKNKTVLDVGCGTGRFVFEYIQQGAKKVVGLDIAAEMIKICKQRAKAARCEKKCQFVQKDLLHYDAKEKFDIVIGIGLFDYLDDPQPVLTAMAKRGKKVIASFPRSHTWRAYARKLRLTLKGCPVYFYSKQRIEELHEAAGLKVTDVEVVGQLYCVTAVRR